MPPSAAGAWRAQHHGPMLVAQRNGQVGLWAAPPAAARWRGRQRVTPGVTEHGPGWLRVDLLAGTHAHLLWWVWGNTHPTPLT